MKRLLTTISIIFLFVGCSGMGKLTEEQLKIQKVYEVNIPKDSIYELSLQWMAQNYVDSKEVMRYKNKEEGRIMGRGATYFYNLYNEAPTVYNLTIEIKENRFRVTFDEPIGYWSEHDNLKRNVERGMYWDKIKPKLKKEAEELYNYIKNRKQKKSSDW